MRSVERASSWRGVVGINNTSLSPAPSMQNFIKEESKEEILCKHNSNIECLICIKITKLPCVLKKH